MARLANLNAIDIVTCSDRIGWSELRHLKPTVPRLNRIRDCDEPLAIFIQALKCVSSRISSLRFALREGKWDEEWTTERPDWETLHGRPMARLLELVDSNWQCLKRLHIMHHSRSCRTEFEKEDPDWMNFCDATQTIVAKAPQLAQLHIESAIRSDSLQP